MKTKSSNERNNSLWSRIKNFLKKVFLKYIEMLDDGDEWENAELLEPQSENAQLDEYSKVLAEISNIELYEENLRKLQSLMISGITFETEGDIQIGDDLFASTNIGKARDNQEDAVLLIKDGKIPNFKIMVVADGMGGEHDGDVASHELVSKVKEWFEQLSDKEKAYYYTNISDIKERLNSLINEASIEISEEISGRGGTTIVCAIIGKNETLITNVGDSRAYIVRNGKLEQVSTDDASVQILYEEGMIPTKDAMRFHCDSNLITAAVGLEMIENIHSTIISNDDYDMILLFSDGVTDCLSEDEIAVITRYSELNKLSNELVKRALDSHSKVPKEVANNNDYYKEIDGGKDNTTVAVYINSKEDDDEGRNS